jgi:putative sigma-54 modulation protein
MDSLININARNMDLTPTLRNYVEKKTARIDRYMPNVIEVDIDLSAENARSANKRQVAQITVRDARGAILRAEERSADMFASVDAVIDKLYRQIKRYRGKQMRHRRAGSEDFVNLEQVPLPDETDEAEVERTIVRRKQFSLRPMIAEEAIEQMEMLGHDFFVFFNADAEAINVLYRRQDENYGLLQPQFD